MDSFMQSKYRLQLPSSQTRHEETKKSGKSERFYKKSQIPYYNEVDNHNFYGQEV
jgi:hypothetical protein